MEYKDLYDIIPSNIWEKFVFSEYFTCERNILKPYLESIGYTNIRFEMGERDSFGPLSRIVYMTISGENIQAVYG